MSGLAACSPAEARARPVRFPTLQSCSHEEHIKCSSARAELAINLTGRARASAGEQAGETQSVQEKYRPNGILADDLSALKTREIVPSMPISVSCGEIGTEFGVETIKQSLFHRNFGRRDEKRRGLLVESSPLLQGAIEFASCGIRPGGR